jgi:hypothetical protein
MPLQIINNYDEVSLGDLVRLRAEGYSVLKSPHVGNQHPSNLVCGALGIPLEMVSFTQGLLDRNFHPHVRIVGGVQTPLYDRRTWTQFASTPCGRSATQYHQQSVQKLFPQTEVVTDMQRMQRYPALAATVLRATNQVIRGVWYRHASANGQVIKKTQRRLSNQALDYDVFQFSNDASGWVIPNRVHIIFDLVYQTLSSGRDVVYHLSGPQMVQYIGDRALQRDLQLMYDAVRQYIPELPLVLKVKIVPVAGARFAGLQTEADGIRAVCDLIESADLVNADRGWYRQLVEVTPSIATAIETGTTISQYDLSHSSDLYIDPWMMSAPLSTVNFVQRELAKVAVAIAAE